MINISKKYLLPIMVFIWVALVVFTNIYINFSGISLANKYDYDYIKYDQAVNPPNMFYVEKGTKTSKTIKPTYFIYYYKDQTPVKTYDNEDYMREFVDMNNHIYQLKGTVFMISVLVSTVALVCLVVSFSREYRLNKLGLIIMSIIPYIACGPDNYIKYVMYFYAFLMLFGLYRFKKSRFIDYDEPTYRFFT